LIAIEYHGLSNLQLALGLSISLVIHKNQVLQVVIITMVVYFFAVTPSILIVKNMSPTQILAMIDYTNSSHQSLVSFGIEHQLGCSQENMSKSNSE